MLRPLVFFLLVTGCGPNTLPVVMTRDASVVIDAGLPADAGVGIDAAVADSGSFHDAGSSADAGPVDAGPADAAVVSDAGRDPLVIERPFEVTVPIGYRAGQPVPLVVVLHGYTVTADVQDTYFGFSRLAQQRTFLVALPNGLRDATLQPYWNATDACCAFGNTNDDVAYLTAVIRDVQARYSVDPKRIFLVGHSNGGFMAHRLACDRAELIAALVSVAGNTWKDGSRCAPSTPVGVLQVHGTLDAVIAYSGGATFGGGGTIVGPPYPSAEDSVKTWGAKNGCSATTLTRLTGNLDLVTAVLGSETTRESVAGCPANSAAELWTIWGGSHFPTVAPDFADQLYTWMLAHAKP